MAIALERTALQCNGQGWFNAKAVSVMLSFLCGVGLEPAVR